MKYVIFEDTHGHAVPILFAERIGFEELREAVPYSTVRSAGYVVLGPQGLRCHGQAPELHAAAGPDDAEAIAAMLRE